MQPSMIAHGATSSINVDVQDLDSWRQIAEGLVKHCEAKSLDKLRLEIYPTVGSAVRIVPDQEVLDFLSPFFEDAKRALQSAE